MHVSASGHRGRPRQRRSQSDPGHSYVTPPYVVQRPAPARQTTEPTRMTVGTSYKRPPSRSSPVERNGDPHPGPPQRLSNSPAGTSPPTPVSPRSLSPSRSGHRRSSSRQDSIRAPHGSGLLIKDVPQPSRAALNVPSAVTTSLPHSASWGQGQGQGVPVDVQLPPTPLQSAIMQRQGSHHSIHQQPTASVYQGTSPTHHSQHRSGHHHHNNSHLVHHRSRSRPPNATSHWYAENITQSVHGHGASVTLNPSRTSLDGGVPSQRNHHVTSLPPGTSSHHPGTGSTYMPSESRSHVLVHSSGTHGTTAAAHGVHKTLPSPPSPPLAANEIHHTTRRPPLPANYDGQIQTRYVNMLLALDDISPLFNILASFFTWILLAGFLLFPGTFASWKDLPAGSPQSDILDVVNHVSLYVIAWICTSIGACGMTWLWWRWRRNYIWITNRIFIPGCLNSIAGVISTLSSIYGAQAGVFGKTEKSTIIVTGALSLICGILVLVYEFWLLRNLKLEHDREVGVEMAGRHGEGILGARRAARTEERKVPKESTM